MNKLWFAILIFCCVSSIGAQTLPDVETVAEKFFSKYHADDYRSIHFEKRPEGYYIAQKDYEFNFTAREKFYDAETERFLSLKKYHTYSGDTVFYNKKAWQIKPKPTVREQVQNYLGQQSNYEREKYKRQPFYGYVGWYKDVIAFYENKSTLTDDELHAVARVYSLAGRTLLSEDFGPFIDKNEVFDLSFGQNVLSESEVSIYLYYHNKSLGAYEELKTRNPNYKTPVGPVTTKYGNEVMSSFVTLLYFQNETVAREVLKDGIYEDYLLKYARSVLRSCPKNAVLFTWGDTDTYPLYYVQAVEGFRTDIIIINLSLLALPRYRSMLLAGPFSAKPLLTGLPDLYYQDRFIIWYEGVDVVDETIEMKALYKLLKDENQYYKYGTPTFVDKHKTYAINVPASTKHYTRQDNSKLIYRRSTNHMMADEVFPMDILQANEWKRPMCFALTCSRLNDWANHAVLEGLVFRIYPDDLPEMDKNSDEKGEVNTNFSLTFWQTEMEYDTVTQVTDFDKAPFYQTNLLSIRKLMYALVKEGKTKEAIILVKNTLKNFPNKVRDWNSTWLPFIDFLKKNDELPTAKEIAETIIDNIENKRIEEFEKQSLLLQLKVFADAYNLKSLSLRCDNLMN